MTERTDLDAFLNRLRGLYNIDLDVIEKATGGLPWPHAKWTAFRDDPPRFLMRCDDETAAAIWGVLKAQQDGRA